MRRPLGPTTPSTPFLWKRDQLPPYAIIGELVAVSCFRGLAVEQELGACEMPNVKLEVYQGNDRTVQVYVRDAACNIVDLTGASAVMTVKETPDGVTVIQKSTTVASEGMIGSADEGEVLFFLVPGDTDGLGARQFAWDVRVTLSNGKAYTVLLGTFDLLEAVFVP